MLSRTISPVLPLLFLVDFAECSLHQQSKPWNPRNETRHITAQKTFDMELHGLILWISMGLLMPAGILAMRMSSAKEHHQTRTKILFYVHVSMQVLSVLIVTVGAVLSIKKFENVFNNNHQRIGLALYGSIYLQVLIGFRRPKRETKRRSTWYFLHWILGTIISLVGILNVYTGLQAYHKKTGKSATRWTIIFTAQVSFMSVVYLFQDKWEYIQKQGVVPEDAVVESMADQIESQKNASNNEPHRKSNALGTLFSRNNALNKLFQLT